MSLAGEIAYKYFHKPLGPIKDSGGIFGYLKMRRGQNNMKRASEQLIIPNFGKPNTTTTVCGVAGKNNWYQMIFCLYSFFKQANINFPVVIIDDGTIDRETKLKMEKAVPYCTVILHKDSKEKSDTYFQSEMYENIRSVKDMHVVFKKLFEARVCIRGNCVVLDADMLFFKRPDTLIDWMQNPKGAIFMHDKFTIYGVQTDSLIQSNSVVPNLNTGIIGLNNDSIDWSEIENMIKLYKEYGYIGYLMEQALYAMYLKGKQSIRLDESNYVILPEKKEVMAPQSVMHHYPTENRQWYYRYGWREIK